MQSSTPQDPVAEFSAAIEQAGLPAPPHIVADGELHRFSTNGKAGDDSGWYALHDNGIYAGAFGCWRSGLSVKWSAKSNSTLDKDQAAELKRRMRKAAAKGRAERRKRQKQAADNAVEIWRGCKPAPADHPYLKKKQVQPHGLKVDDDGLLVVPMVADGKPVNIQSISPGGDKAFLTGGRVQGTFFPLGRIGKRVYIAEGFATAATLFEATGTATAVAFNAGNLKPVAEVLRTKYPDAEIIIAADNDIRTDGTVNTGVAKAKEAAKAVGGRVVVPELDGQKCDFNDVFVKHGADAVRKQVEAACLVKSDAVSDASQAGNAGQECMTSQDEPTKNTDDESKSAATRLIEIAVEQFRLGISDDGDVYAVPRTGPKIVAMLRGNKHSLRGQLARIYFHRMGRAASQQALADALQVLDGMAQDAEPQPLHLRVANTAEAIWYDIGDTTGRAIRIAGGTWSIEPQPPVLFKRTALNGALPDPQPGELADLWQLLNIAEADRPLLAAWLVSVLYEDIAHPVLAFFGEQGTGKTTAQRLLVDLVDPSPVPTRKPPRDADSWVTAASGSWVVGLDNLSYVPAWLSDSICRAVTGDGDVRRRLYTDNEHSVFAFRRCVVLNGIDIGATRGDLAERMLPIHLETIADDRRVGDQEIWPTWAKLRPHVLGGLLDLIAACANSDLPKLAERSRMADFLQILAAVDSALGTNGLEHYREKQRAMATDALSGDPLIAAIEAGISMPFDGTAAELLDLVAPEKAPKGFPENPRVVTQRLHRHAPALRKAGWHISNDGGNNHRNATVWMLIPPGRPEITCNSDSRTSRSSQTTPSASHARNASHKYATSQDDDGGVFEI